MHNFGFRDLVTSCVDPDSTLDANYCLYFQGKREAEDGNWCIGLAAGEGLVFVCGVFRYGLEMC